MKLKQISVSLENAPGRLYDVTSALGEAGINLRALSLQETGDFGVLRLLVSDVATARHIMMEKHFPARVDDVVAVEIDDKPGSLAAILQPLRARKIHVRYMYAFTGFSSGKAVMIFRFSNNDAAVATLEAHGAKLLDAEAFGILEST